ncbi:histone-lysine N-methyltransferase SETDB1-A isoform X1 [Osmerus mordax]|uniref:histone-lysine N-methyltransferase SETDB1-A isoform X1 n=1 Tax=Osmerus mordax TaxID=8014 RepID=UPI00350FB193
MEGAHRDEDDMDMTVEQLRCWIQKEVEGNKLLNLKKTQLDQMKMLIERREEQTTSTKVLLNRTHELMAGCETSMKELYCEIGMVYKETDSEEEEEIQPMVIEIDDEDDAVDLDEDGDVMCVDNGEEAPQIVNGREGDKKCEGESSLSLVSERDSDPQEPPCLPSETPGTENWTDQPSPASTAASSPPRGISPVSRTDSSPDLLSRRPSSADETQDQIPPRKQCFQQVAARFPVLKNGKEVVVLSKLPVPRLLDSVTRTRAQREEEKQAEEKQAEEKQAEELQEDELPEAELPEAELPEAELPEAELPEAELQEAELQEAEQQEEEIQEEEMEEEEEKQEAAEESDGSDASWKPPKGSYQSSSAGTESSKESDADSIPGTKRLGRGAAAAPRSRAGPGLATHKGQTKTKRKGKKGDEPSELSRNPSSTGTPSRTGTSGSPASAQPPQGNTGKSSVVPPSSNRATQIPPQLSQEAIKVGMMVLARRSTENWQQSKILEIKSADNDNRDKYKVDLKEMGSWLPGHHIAFDHTPSLGSLYVGVRLLAKGQEDNQSGFSSGTLAELPIVKNRMRFLVFLDNGTPCYVGLPRLRLVCRPLESISDEDIEDKTYKDFLVEYLKVYPYTPMAQYRLGQHINTEHNGIQKRCQVEAIDSSLIHILFQDDQHKEWLYRGSTRLQHLAQMKKQASKETSETSALPQQSTTSAVSKPRKYQKILSSSASGQASSSAVAPSKPAKRSPLTSTVIPPRASSAPYTVHRCCPACLGPRGEHRGCNPLFFPLLCGFSRKKARFPVRGYKKKSFHIFYRSPCGVSLASMSVLEDYLHQTRCDYLSINMFCLDPTVSVTTTFQPKEAKIFIPDLSQGHEVQPLSCINELHNHRPRGIFSYIKKQVGDGAVSINNSLDFLVGCDCTDGCRDRTSCSCHQLTVEATALEAGGIVDVNAGYSHMKLEKRLPTGVYECNSLCRCDPRFCSNRVVQHGLQARLQVFMTQRKGWGVRCLDDVAMGSFICCYAGKVLTSEEFKNNMVDLFCTKLSLIEGVETHSKDGYESEAPCSENETDGSDSEQVRGGEDRAGSDRDTNSKSDVEYRSGVSSLKRSYVTRRNNKLLQEGPEKEAESEDKSPVRPTDKNDKEEGSSTTRRFFEDEKTSYVVSSKAAGNVARFFNHSCSPNLFGQNVFVDNHDLRFPWIAFFAKTRIKAGSELTWDYRSQIGALNERVVKCLCSSPKCRGKI